MKSSLVDLTTLPIKELSSLISSRKISCVELVDQTFEKIKKLNPRLNAFITITEESARLDAKRADGLLRRGKYLGPLHGIPISVKDLIYVKGVRSTSGSKILADFVPTYDSTVVYRLKNAGAIIVGTNNTHEFACGITNINPHFGSSKNPWDPTRMSGGSSGGSAVAVSAGMSAATIGTDTSGSIRVPSSLCGIFGLKPTYGRVSKHGVMPLAPSIDHIGPIARSAWDIAAVLKIIAGHDPLDSATVDAPVPDYLKEISKKSAGKGAKGKASFKLAIPREFFFDIIDPKVMDVFVGFVDKIKACRISTSRVDMHNTDRIVDTWRAFRLGESAATHSEWVSTRRQDYGEDVVTMLDRGMQITAVHYISAHKWRDQIRESFLRAVEGFDAMLVPTTIIPAPFLDQKEVGIGGKMHEVYPSLSRLTTVFDITGLPALNVPAGFVDGKLPVGVQLVGRPFDESRILKIAYTYEQYYRLQEQFIPPIQ
jgi:aspartyl-tRNA(Asn)/glutamyl-tRNA(Gln) amidotransferase subunit A